jgi:hypothetical protein
MLGKMPILVDGEPIRGTSLARGIVFRDHRDVEEASGRRDRVLVMQPHPGLPRPCDRASQRFTQILRDMGAAPELAA